MRHYILPLFALGLLVLGSCSKKPNIIPDNNAPYYGDVPTVLVQNYVNRLFIDLIGREPLDAEMEAEVKFLRDNELTIEARKELATKLQTDTAWIEGDTSYNNAYYKRLYDLCKSRLIEGASNSEIGQQIGIYHNGYIIDSINGNITGMQEKQAAIDKLQGIKNSEREYRMDSIGLNDMHARMIDNYFYDLINMNTFNFINATFNDLYFRYPTQSEFTTAFDIIEYNSSSTIFGQSAQNKEDYIGIVTETREFYEGLIIWAYKTLIAREPTSQEVYDLMSTFYYDHDFQYVQKTIVVSDEYANFN